MKTRNILPLLVTVLFLLATVSAYAQHGMGHGRESQEKAEHGMQGMQKGMHECLELTAEQLKQVKEFKFEMKKKLIPWHQKIRPSDD